MPRRGGGLVLAVRDGIAVASDPGDGFEPAAPAECDTPGNRLNDAKCEVGTASLPCGLAADYRIKTPDHPAPGDDANPAERNAGGSVNHRLRGVIRATRYV